MEATLGFSHPDFEDMISGSAKWRKYELKDSELVDYIKEYDGFTWGWIW